MAHYIRVTPAQPGADTAAEASKILGNTSSSYPKHADVFPPGALIYKLVGKLVEKPQEQKKIALPFKPGQTYIGGANRMYVYLGCINNEAVWRQSGQTTRLYATNSDGKALQPGYVSITPEYNMEVSPAKTVYQAIED